MDAGQQYVRPSVPDGGILLEMPAFTVAPGAEVTMCWVSPVTLTSDTDFTVMDTYQFDYAHHLALYYVSPPRTPGMHPCTEQDMIDDRLVAANGGEAATMSSGTSNVQHVTVPAGTGIRMPRGAQLVVESHYVNTSTRPVPARDALVVFPVAAGSIRHYVDNYAMGDATMSMPARQAYGRSSECTIDDGDLNIISVSGHTHQFGTHLKITHFPASGPANVLYDEAAGLRLQNNAPSRDWPPDQPYVIRRGDRVRIDCDWLNTSDHTVEFPEEMCGGLMLYYPARGFLTCQRVVETRGGGDAGVLDGGGNAGCPTPPGPSDPCVRTCNTGNEIGIGKYCTAGGGQCNGNRSGILCTADFDPTGPGFCTRPCSTDSMCGSGAVCHHEEQGSGCVPVACEVARTPDAGTRD